MVERYNYFIISSEANLIKYFQVLSRAFRNRFLELHFDDIPSSELVIILQLRCRIPKSYSQQLVTVSVSFHHGLQSYLYSLR